MRHFLKWNPVVPGAVLAFTVYLAVLDHFRARAIVTIFAVALWFGLSIARLSSVRARTLTAPIGKRRLLTDAELEARIGKERLAALSRARFGGVVISDTILSGQRPAGMIRVEPEADVNFNGWVFMAFGDMYDQVNHQKLHDCLEVLRVAPEVASYLDSPVGTHLVRTGERKFEPAPNKQEPSKTSPQPTPESP